MPTQPPGIATAPGVRPASVPSSTLPLAERVVARMGNLGWDTSKDVIVARAKEVLSNAGVKEDEYVGLHAVRQEGSLAELLFTSPMALQKAKFSVIGANASYVEGKCVWLDVKKGREELRPARLVHRISELIEEAESARPDKMPVGKVMNGKYVKVGEQKVGYSCKASWIWTRFGQERYGKDFCDMAKAYSEDD